MHTAGKQYEGDRNTESGYKTGEIISASAVRKAIEKGRSGLMSRWMKTRGRLSEN